MLWQRYRRPIWLGESEKNSQRKHIWAFWIEWIVFQLEEMVSVKTKEESEEKKQRFDRHVKWVVT